MKFKLKTLTAAVALAGFMANASAATTGPASADGLPNNGTGSGIGDLIFAYEGASGLSIIWDLFNPTGGARSDVNFNDMLGAPSFSISNAAVTAFVAANPGGRWNVFGLTNVRNTAFGASGASIRYLQAGGATTLVGSAPNFVSGNSNGANMESFIDNHAGWINAANNGGLNASDTIEAGPADPWQFNTGAGHGPTMLGQNSAAGLNATMGFWSLLIDPTKNRGLSASATNALGSPVVATQLGSFTFNGENLSYAPIPVPPAVWLFGSAMAGLIGLRRRAV